MNKPNGISDKVWEMAEALTAEYTQGHHTDGIRVYVRDAGDLINSHDFVGTGAIEISNILERQYGKMQHIVPYRWVGIQGLPEGWLVRP